MMSTVVGRAFKIKSSMIMHLLILTQSIILLVKSSLQKFRKLSAKGIVTREGLTRPGYCKFGKTRCIYHYKVVSARRKAVKEHFNKLCEEKYAN